MLDSQKVKPQTQAVDRISHCAAALQNAISLIPRCDFQPATQLALKAIDETARLVFEFEAIGTADDKIPPADILEKLRCCHAIDRRTYLHSRRMRLTIERGNPKPLPNDIRAAHLLKTLRDWLEHYCRPLSHGPLPPRPNKARGKRRGEILEKNEGRCVYCGIREATTIDHITPRSQGGRNCKSNLVGACTFCNEAKGDRSADQWAKDILKVVDSA